MYYALGVNDPLKCVFYKFHYTNILINGKDAPYQTRGKRNEAYLSSLKVIQISKFCNTIQGTN